MVIKIYERKINSFCEAFSTTPDGLSKNTKLLLQEISVLENRINELENFKNDILKIMKGYYDNFYKPDNKI